MERRSFPKIAEELIQQMFKEDLSDKSILKTGKKKKYRQSRPGLRILQHWGCKRIKINILLLDKVPELN